MSAYDNDPRVTRTDDAAGAYQLQHPGDYRVMRVWQRRDGSWVAQPYGGPTPGGYLGEYATADEAIRSLIGDPE